MSKIDDGGPAFPVESYGFSKPTPGMTYRQWLVGQALAGPARDWSYDGRSAQSIAKAAVALADAAIAAEKIIASPPAKES